MKLNATIANLRLFNSGVYKDVTISFPTTTEKIHSALRKIAIDGRENKEILITQYETDIKGLAAHLGEYEDIDELNYLASRLAGFSPYEMAVFSAAVQHAPGFLLMKWRCSPPPSSTANTATPCRI